MGLSTLSPVVPTVRLNGTPDIMPTMKSINYLFPAIMALLVDVVTFLALLLFLPRLTSIMADLGGLSALLVGGAFLLFVVGVFLIRRLTPTPRGNAEWLSRNRRAGLALFFAFVISLALAWQLGFFASAAQVDTTQMGEGGASSYFVYGPGAWLAFSLLYVLVFAFRVTPGINFGWGYIAAALFGLAAANGMLIVLVAQGQVILAAAGGGWGWAIPAFLVLVLMFGPPRLLYLSRTTGLTSPAAYSVIAVFLLLLGICAAQMAITIF